MNFAALFRIGLLVLGQGTPSPSADFVLAPGFVIEEFAADPKIAKPIQMNFDQDGRLWIVSSESYPQLKPGEPAHDRIFVLEDRDGDGKAELTHVFAEGLLIPTGIEIGDKKVYVGHSTEVLEFDDKDGDLKADGPPKVLLSGFGTEDTHHLVHTFRWAPGGSLFFAQSIYIHSHIETPWGVRRLNGGGFWSFETHREKLEVFVHGMVNPWGLAFDQFGQAFAVDNDTNSPIKYLLPGARFAHTPGESLILDGIVKNKPKYCGAEFITGRHFPDDFQNNFVTCDFRAHRVCRYRLEEAGSGYRAIELEPLVTGKNVTFRPIDAKMGPDGALYVADWYNPIINHGEVDFRDPRRDQTRGRIWRISYRDRPPVARQKLSTLGIEALLAQQSVPEGFTQQFARRALANKSPADVLPLVQQWSDAQKDEIGALRALWTYQTLNMPNSPALERVLNAKDGRVRAAGIRVALAWRHHLADPFPIFAKGVHDEHPRVRLESVRALSDYRTFDAIKQAFMALDHPMDEFLEYACKLTARETQASWLPVLAQKINELKSSDQAKHWVFALLAVNTPESERLLALLFQQNLIEASKLPIVLESIGRLGSGEDLAHVFSLVMRTDSSLSVDQRVSLLDALKSAAVSRKVVPTGNLEAPLETLIRSTEERIRLRAVELVGLWRVEKLRTTLLDRFNDTKERKSVRESAVNSMADLGGPESEKTLADLFQSASAPDREFLLRGLVRSNLPTAANLAAPILAKAKSREESSSLFNSFLSRAGGPDALAGALGSMDLDQAVAAEGVRILLSSAEPSAKLLSTLVKAGKLPDTAREPSATELANLARKVLSVGNASKGEALYKREKLQCVKCHMINEKGGKVGPDLSTIGASAPVDYLVESLLAPNKKIKEGYHSIVVVSHDGSIVSGIPIRKDEKEIVLRTADDKMVTMPAADIEQTKQGNSLMPVGLVDELTGEEFIDLVRYLSELGKPGQFGFGEEKTNRRWLIHGPLTAAQFADLDQAIRTGKPKDVLGQGEWKSSPTTNAGWIYVREFTLNPAWFGVWSAAKIDVQVAGKIKFMLEPGLSGQLWFAGKKIEPISMTRDVGSYELSLPAGQSVLFVRVDLKRHATHQKLTAHPLEPRVRFDFADEKSPTGK